MPKEINSYERLAPYYEAARAETQEHRLATSIIELDTTTRPQTGFREALTADSDVAVIAEHKRCSPSEGDIRPDSTVEWTVSQYRKGGAAALSILTQGQHFGGSIGDIEAASNAVDLPILRKDFIDSAYQLHEAKAYGAAAALLIVAGLSDRRLHELSQEARMISLECLVEVHDKTELKRALKVSPAIIGVNNRNLSTLKTDIRTAEKLIPKIPDDITTVAESGYSVRDPEHIRRLRELGADAVLMGTALMRQDNPAEALVNWLATGQSR